MSHQGYPFALTALLLAAPLACQDDDTFAPYTEVLDDGDAVPPPANDFLRVAVSDFEGDLRADVASLHGGTVSVFRAAVVTRQPLPLATPAGWVANDLAASDPRVDPAPPRLYLVGNDGLRVAAFDVQTQTMTNTLALAGAWVGASRLACGWAGSGRLIVGLHASGTMLLFATDIAGTITQIATVSLPSAGGDLTLLDWHGNGALVAAVTTQSDGLLLVDPAGSTTPLATAAAGSFLARLQDGTAPDELAWLHPGTGGGWALRILRSGSADADVPLCSVTDPNGIDCGDLDNDGRTDCAITQRSTYDGVVLLRQIGGQSPPTQFFADTPETRATFVSLASPHPGTPLDLAPPVFRDVDRDGKADVVIGLTSAETVVVVAGIATGDVGGIDDGILATADDSTYLVDPAYSTTEYTLGLTVDAHDIPAGMHEVEVVCWTGTFQSAGQEWVIDGLPRSHRFHPLHEDPQAGGRHVIPTLTGETTDNWSDGRHMFYEVRFVERDASGALLDATPSYVLGMTLPRFPGDPPSAYMNPLRSHLEKLSDDEKKVRKVGAILVDGIVPPRRVPPPPFPTGGGSTPITNGPTTTPY